MLTTSDIVPLTMAAMIGKAALELDWTHHATKRSEEIKVFATLFPMVSASKWPGLCNSFLTDFENRMNVHWFSPNVHKSVPSYSRLFLCRLGVSAT
jgi:hypothetical protein